MLISYNINILQLKLVLKDLLYILIFYNFLFD